MSAMAAFVLGLLIGWVVEWIIDWIYWRRKTSALQKQVAELNEEVKQAATRQATLEHQLTLQKVNLTNLQEKLASTEADLAQARSLLAEKKQEETIHLAHKQAPSEPVAEVIVEPPAPAEPMAPVVPVVPVEPVVLEKTAPVESAAAAQGEFVSFAVGDTTQSTAPETAPVVDAGVPIAPVVVPGTTRASSIERDAVSSIERDDLEIIKGIGPVIARKLNQAGIFCFADLAALTPDQLRALVGDVISRLADEDSIIEQAKHLAEQKKSGG